MNTVDTRDLYKRKCELEGLRDAVTAAKDELQGAEQALDLHNTDEPDDKDAPEWDSWDDRRDDLEDEVSNAEDAVASAKDDFGTDEQEELAELESLESDIGSSAFMHGETMILERDFEEYARELAEDVHGRGVRDAEWPFNCIDWEQAASELQQDYTTVTYQGDDYLVRA